VDWSIQEIARLAGTTSRTLRHYGDIGLLSPTRVGGNGYRYYDDAALVRLQRILLLRQLGLGLPAIAEVLAGERDDTAALQAHLRWLRSERERLAVQISSVESTIAKLKGGEQLMAEEMLNGFDHTAYKDEVSERWGADAYAAGDKWWSAKTAEEKKAFQAEQVALAAHWADAAARALDPSGTAAQALARRQYDWLAGIPGTPGFPDGPSKDYFVGLGEMYVADDRFAANYGGPTGAAFVRDAMAVFADREL
jgi:DNA-binding transcriptional MerR regulator